MYCLSYTAYCAQMTTILSTADTSKTDFSSLDDAIDKGGTICLMGSFIKDMFQKRYPQLGGLKERLVRFESAPGIFQAMDGGYKINKERSNRYDTVAQTRDQPNDIDDWGTVDGYCDAIIVTATEYELAQNGKLYLCFGFECVSLSLPQNMLTLVIIH